MDTAIFYAINHGTQNPLFDSLMPAISQYATWSPLIAAIFLYLIYRDKAKGAWLFVAAAGAVGGADFISSHLLKPLFDVARPCMALPDVHLLTGCSNSGSFPSSHAANSFAVASVLGFYDRRLWAFALPIALMVCFSRPYLGVHYPSDVAAGGLLGLGVGYGIVRASGLARVAESAPIK